MIDESTLREIVRLADAATPGPWEWSNSNSWLRLSSPNGDGDVLCPTKAKSDGHPDLIINDDNGYFIVAACNNARAMAERLMELEAKARDRNAVTEARLNALDRE